MSATIHSVCVRPQHRASVAGDRTLTVHDGEWAYCPDGADGEHDWKAIVPVSLDDLLRSVRAEHSSSLGAA
jgi:hypothetical protein